MKFNKELVKGSLILLITLNLFSILNLLFNLLMARSLSLSDYGLLVTLNYIILIFAIVSESIQTVLAKYVSKEKDEKVIKDILTKSFFRATKMSLIVFLFYLLIAIFFSYYLSINYLLLAVAGISIFFSFILPIFRGISQGRKEFFILGSSFVFEAIAKIIISIILIFIGWKVFGALVGIILGMLFGLLFSFFGLRDILISERSPSKTPEIYNYTKPVFITNASLVLFLSLDIILARALFAPEVVGAYAISSSLAKIIFIGTQPIGRALFPLAAEENKKMLPRQLFVSSVSLLGLLLFFSLTAFYLFPEKIVEIYAGKSLIASSTILFYLGTSMAFLSLANLTILFKLSRGAIIGYWLLIILPIIQILILILFSKDLETFSLGMLLASIIFLFSVSIIKNK